MITERACVVCRRLPRAEASPFCEMHENRWRTSPEHRRAFASGDPAVRVTALADFATRITLEGDSEVLPVDDVQTK